MTTTLNASTSSGFVMTPDNSGVIALQNNGTTALTLDASGRPLTPLRPAFHASGGTINTSVSSGNYILWAVNYSNCFNIGSCYNASTGKFTVPVTGAYQFSFNAYPNAGTGGNIRLIVNDVNTSSGGPLCQIPGNSNYPTSGLSVTLYLNAGDLVGTKVVTGSNYIDGDCRFSGFLVG